MEKEVAISAGEYCCLVRNEMKLELIENWARQSEQMFVPDAIRIILGMTAPEKPNAEAGKDK